MNVLILERGDGMHAKAVGRSWIGCESLGQWAAARIWCHSLRGDEPRLEKAETYLKNCF